MATLTIDPPTLQVPATGGESTHQLNNPGETRLAFKIKSSNNDHYRVNPVYGYAEPGASATIQVTRLVGPFCFYYFFLRQIIFSSPTNNFRTARRRTTSS